MSQPRNIFEALDNPFWLCSGGLRMFSTLSISKQKVSVLHQRPHKQIRKSQSIVKRQLIKYSMLTQFLTIRQIAQSSVALIDANVKFTSSLERFIRCNFLLISGTSFSRTVQTFVIIPLQIRTKGSSITQNSCERPPFDRALGACKISASGGAVRVKLV